MMIRITTIVFIEEPRSNNVWLPAIMREYKKLMQSIKCDKLRE